MDKYKFEQRVKELLLRQRFSQAEVARQLNVSRSTVNKWLTGENLIAYESLFQLCELLGLQEAERVELFSLAGYQHLPIQEVTSHAKRAYDAILYRTAQIAKRPEILIGRDGLVSQVEAELNQAKHVLVTGYGGTGKTALASTIAGRWLEAGKGAVLWFVADSEDEDVLLEAMVAPLESSVDASFKRGDAKVLAVQESLGEAGVTLVVLDDLSFVHMLPTVRAAMPVGIPLLVTSRYDAANLDATVKLAGLGGEEAVALLAHHAQNSALSKESYLNDVASMELCRRLHAHALAIVIAGGWLKQNRRRAHDLVRRLDEGQLSPLSVEMTASTRIIDRESVMKVLYQTYRQLDSRSRMLFRAFGQLDKARVSSEFLAICVDEKVLDVENALDELVSWNFADREGSNIYSLHDLVHLYAVELRRQRGEQRELATVVERYTAHYSHDFEGLGVNLGNVIAVAEVAEDRQRLQILRPLYLQGYCDANGYRRELLLLLDQLLDYLGELRRAGRMNEGERRDWHFLIGKRGNAYFDHGEYAKAAVMFEASLELAPNLERKVKLMSLVGKSLAFDGQEGAQKYFSEAYELSGDDEALRSFVLEQESHSAGIRGDHATASRIAAEQVAINKRLVRDDASNERMARLFLSLCNLGTAQLQLDEGAAGEVRKIYEEAMAIALQLNHPEYKAHATWALAEAVHAEGDREQAWHFLSVAYATFQEQGKSRHCAEVAKFMREHGYPDPAEQNSILQNQERRL